VPFVKPNLKINVELTMKENSENTQNTVLNKADVSSRYLELINLADKIINGDEKTFGMIQCLDHYYNGAWDDDLAKFDKLRSEIGNGC
jgi:hypothetical protein